MKTSNIISVAFRDVALLMALAFVVVIFLLLTPTKQDENKSEVKAQGNVMVEAFWPDGWNTDVDLWVQAPGDVPVGYSNKGGVIFNLLRDDLGSRADATENNYEMSYARGAPPGEYTINVQLYSNFEEQYPVPVTIVVSTKAEERHQATQILATQVKLTRRGQELTALRFRLDEGVNLVPGSVNTISRMIRNMRREAIQ